MNLTCSAAQVAVSVIVLVFLGSTVPSYAQGSPLFYEISAFGGSSLKPDGSGPVTELNVGLGAGKNTLDLRVGHQPLNNYILGMGRLYQNFDGLQVPVADSVIVDIGGDFRRDLYTKPRLVVYGSLGGGYIRQRYSVFEPCTNCSSVFFHHSNTVGLSLAAGVRIPLWKGIGIRGEMQGWVFKGTSEHDELNANHIATVSTNVTKSDQLVRATIGIYYRWFSRL